MAEPAGFARERSLLSGQFDLALDVPTAKSVAGPKLPVPVPCRSSGLLAASLFALGSVVAARAALQGDANCDGLVNTADLPAVVEGIFGNSTCAGVDVNGDGRATAADLVNEIPLLVPAISPTPTVTPSPTNSPAVSPTRTVSGTPTRTPTHTFTQTITETPTWTIVPTATRSITPTPTWTPTLTGTPATATPPPPSQP